MDMGDVPPYEGCMARPSSGAVPDSSSGMRRLCEAADPFRTRSGVVRPSISAFAGFKEDVWGVLEDVVGKAN